MVSSAAINARRKGGRQMGTQTTMIRVYFSFDYTRDLHRIKPFAQLPNIMSRAPAGFQRSSIWHEARKRGDAEIQGLINDALRGTAVSVFCIGLRTAYSKFIQYEIEQSLAQGNGLLAITINHLRDQEGAVDAEAPVPPSIHASGFKTYRYSDPRTLVQQIEEAARLAKEVPEAERTSERRAKDRRKGDRRSGSRRSKDRAQSPRRSRILKKEL
jgi:hypothetical protein